MSVTPASDEEVREWAERNALMIGSTYRRSVVGRERALIARIDAEKAARAKAEAERDALRERLTLTDYEREMCRVLRRMAGDFRGDRCIGSDVRELLRIIDRLTKEATDG